MWIRLDRQIRKNSVIHDSWTQTIGCDSTKRKKKILDEVSIGPHVLDSALSEAVRSGYVLIRSLSHEVPKQLKGATR